MAPQPSEAAFTEFFENHGVGLRHAFIARYGPEVGAEVMGDVEGRLCVLTDDMIDTGGTIVSAAEILLQRGAAEVWAMASHGVLSGPASRTAGRYM